MRFFYYPLLVLGISACSFDSVTDPGLSIDRQAFQVPESEKESTRLTIFKENIDGVWFYDCVQPPANCALGNVPQSIFSELASTSDRDDKLKSTGYSRVTWLIKNGIDLPQTIVDGVLSGKIELSQVKSKDTKSMIYIFRAIDQKSTESELFAVKICSE